MNDYHWIMTVQSGPQQSLMSGTITAQPGQTRADMYERLYELVSADTGLTKPLVLFFSLEPNQLGGTA